MKEMLVKKFVSKYGLNQLGEKNIRIQSLLIKIVNECFAKFIEQSAFTEKNLVQFELRLELKIQKLLHENGIKHDMKQYA